VGFRQSRYRAILAGFSMYRISDNVRSTYSEDGAIVLDVHQGRVFRLNATASLVLSAVQQGNTESQIVRDMSEEFGAPAEVVESDVSELLNALERFGVIHNAGDPTS